MEKASLLAEQFSSKINQKRKETLYLKQVVGAISSQQHNGAYTLSIYVLRLVDMRTPIHPCV